MNYLELYRKQRRKYDGASIGTGYMMDPNQMYGSKNNLSNYTSNPYNNLGVDVTNNAPTNESWNIPKVNYGVFDYGEGNSTNSGWNKLGKYSGLISSGVNAIGNAILPDDIPTNDKQRYMAAGVAKQDAGSGVEDLTKGITNAIPIANIAHSVGSLGSDLIEQKNKYGYSDASDFALGVSGFLDPGRTMDQAFSSMKEGKIGTGIAELLLPGWANIRQNREAKKAAQKAGIEYDTNKLFEDNFNYFNSNENNRSRMGNTFQLRNGGTMSNGNGMSKKLIGDNFNRQINSVEYNGPSHNNGGIPIGKNTEVEGGEAKHDNYVFSNMIPYK